MTNMTLFTELMVALDKIHVILFIRRQYIPKQYWTNLLNLISSHDVYSNKPPEK